ncbi:SLAM family member 5-like [Zootoca vivipara]|uniref:SLAM family member 5-like n=1 Tax=Zootoca vivipara TaxID=8524 RepID=UPI00293C11FF|nr:SLAM family member 5-like [Zootoca vivipara]XP_060125767.1 SLAM family member 5-like [Zootoca vivipara]XP_060125768.1 SLAM family member 5-like [Zootoca vivipara]
MQTHGGWLWILLLFPLTAHQAEESEHPSKDDQIKHLQAKFVNTTWQQNESFTLQPTYNRTDPSNRDLGVITTLSDPAVKSKTEHQGRRPLEPAITIHSVNGTCNVTLNCVVTGGEGEDVTYAWSTSEMGTVLSEEPFLHITQKPPDQTWDYTCTVHNKESQNSSTVSLRGHCHDPSTLDQGALTSLYAKYLAPLLLVLVLLLILFLMYRRKRGRGSHSRTVSIIESSDSDFPAAEEATQLNPEGFKPIPEEPLEMVQVQSINNNEEASTTQAHQPNVQARCGLP